MRLLFYGFVLICAAIACSQSSATNTPNPDMPPDGKKIYNQFCKLCHGSNGKLMLNEAKDLTKSELNLEERIYMITNGKGMMQPYRELLTKKEIKAVAEYTQTLIPQE